MKQRKMRTAFLKGRLNRISLFWKYMLMMLCILLVCLCALLVIYRSSLNSLTEENLEKLHVTLNRDCEALDSEFYAANYISYAIEDSQYYPYIENSKSGYLEKEGYFVLSLLEKTLTNQIYQQADSDRILFYNSSTNSIVSTTHVVPDADAYFDTKLTFAETPSETIFFYLKKPNTIKLLPVQPVYILGAENSQSGTDRLTLIMRPKNSKISLMTVYSLTTVLDKLSYSNLPEGTYVELRDADDEVILQYPQAVTEEIMAESYQLNSNLRKTRASVSIWIPKGYFAESLQPVNKMGLSLIAAVILIGLALILFFSRASVRPIRELLRVHEDTSTVQSTNELYQLDQMLSNAQKRTTQMREKMNRQLLARAMSGSVLGEQDEKQLQQSMPLLHGEYRVAILNTTEEVNGILGKYLAGVMPEILWVLINNRETGLVLQSREDELLRLQTALKEVQTGKDDIFCGVSKPCASLKNLHNAVQQARAALPRDAGLNIFPGEENQQPAISWLQHERLYQFIFSNREDKALNLLSSIAEETNQSNAREVFYNIRFILRCAAEEMEVPLPWEKPPEYVPSRLPQENIENLQVAVHALFANIAEKNGRKNDTRLEAILGYIQENMEDSELCVAAVAKHFGISERLLYDIMQKKAEMSFNEYLTGLRMELAAKLLQTTHINVAEVGQRCGYRISSTFYRLFKDYYGMSPGQYRSSARQGDEGQKTD